MLLGQECNDIDPKKCSNGKIMPGYDCDTFEDDGSICYCKIYLLVITRNDTVASMLFSEDIPINVDC